MRLIGKIQGILDNFWKLPIDSQLYRHFIISRHKTTQQPNNPMATLSFPYPVPGCCLGFHQQWINQSLHRISSHNNNSICFHIRQSLRPKRTSRIQVVSLLVSYSRRPTIMGDNVIELKLWWYLIKRTFHQEFCIASTRLTHSHNTSIPQPLPYHL